MEIDDWKEKKDISITDMQEHIKVLRELKTEYDTAKKLSTKAYDLYKDKEIEVIEILKGAGQDNFTVKGVGAVSLSETLSVQTPKSPEQKQAFFDWLKKEMGEDGFWAYATVNSASLNSLYKQKVAEYGQRGEVLEVEGLNQPTSYTKLSLRKA